MPLVRGEREHYKYFIQIRCFDDMLDTKAKLIKILFILTLVYIFHILILCLSIHTSSRERLRYHIIRYRSELMMFCAHIPGEYIGINGMKSYINGRADINDM